jgi:putative DNA primase/helicase
MNTEEILTRLEGVFGTANGWQARCPAHDDAKASLSIAEDDGKTLLYCQAGCATADVVEAMGLQMRDLFPDESGERKLVATYDYPDKNGKLRYQILRYSPKAFQARRPDGNGGWVYSVEGVKLVPYRLPTIVEHNWVLGTEGEKDADTACDDLRLAATTNPFGARKWRPEFAEYFANKTVTLIPHQDEAGRKHMQEVACSLFPVAKTVRIVELPFGNDLTEWHKLGGTREQLIVLAKAASAVTAEQVQEWQASHTDDAGLRMKSLRELMNQPKRKVRWIVEGLLPAGGTSLLTAKPKVGKSTLTRCLALAVARGDKFLGRKTLQGTVLYLAPQEIESEVTAHFKSLGATGDEPIHACFVITSEFGIPKLQELIEKYKPALVVLDQLLHFLRIRDESKYAEVTRALQPIEALARKFDRVHIHMTYHAGKSPKADAGDDPLGSTAFFGAVDTLLILKRLPNDSRTLESRQRYKDIHGNLPETILQFHAVTGAVSLGVARDGYEIQRIGDDILRGLRRNSGKWFREEAILSHVEGGQAYKRKALRELNSEGKISRTGKGTRGDPYRYSVE